MVRKIAPMVDMALDRKEAMEYSSPSPPAYPYGLCISLCNDEIEKLGLEDDNVEVGDMLHMHVLAKVTSTSENDYGDGPHRRIELQITHISAEDEDEENEEEDVPSRLYKKR